jgi:hypothetical protein
MKKGCWYRNVIAVVLGTLLLVASVHGWQRSLGYQDTPIIPGTNWHVHDGLRPQPKMVTPAEQFSQLAPPPSDATILFGGADLGAWQHPGGEAATWPVKGDHFEAGRGLIRTRQKFNDFQLHLEFATPAPAHGEGQGRGNSGLMINGMYEVQILDNYENQTYPDGQCGAIYGQTPPLVNSCKKPGEWQTYDVLFEGPRWDEQGKLIREANVTVLHNGVVLHHKRNFIGCTDGIGGVPHTSLAKYGEPHAPEMFIDLQDHGNPLKFRNIWIREMGSYDRP